MQALDTGGAFVGWGGLQPVFTEFDSAGETVFDARFRAPGVESYRAYRFPWSAAPAENPRAVARATGSDTAVSVSWNGSTEVARWRVRAPDGIAATRRRTGFETTLVLRARVRTITVEGLDATGRVLAKASPVAVVRSGSESRQTRARAPSRR
jgi:hypothetical protein